MTDAELEVFFITAVSVGGRPTKTIAQRLDFMLTTLATKHGDLSPFALINLTPEKEISQALQAAGIGLHEQKAKALCFAAGLWVCEMLDLRNCTLDELEAIKFVGVKTARFFVMHTRPTAKVVALDDHILKHLSANGVKAPYTVPAMGRTYLLLEREFIRLADEAKMNPAEYEHKIWRQYAAK